MVLLKKILQFIGLISIILFSFFYTDKVLEVIREEDSIMIELNRVKDISLVKPIDAVIESQTIIPGLNGKSININKSYKAMKAHGTFQQSDIVYDVIHPDISVVFHKDKYIVQGNAKKQMVSFIFLLNHNKYLDRLEKIIDTKDMVVNFFVDYGYLVSNSTKIKDMEYHEFYSYGDNGKYTPDNLLFSNNLISRISNHNANLCLVLEKNFDVINLCSKSDLYTVLPNIIVREDAYRSVKNEVVSGSMILFYVNQDTLGELSTVIDYVQSKGLKIVGLSQLLSESLE